MNNTTDYSTNTCNECLNGQGITAHEKSHYRDYKIENFHRTSLELDCPFGRTTLHPLAHKGTFIDEEQATKLQDNQKFLKYHTLLVRFSLRLQKIQFDFCFSSFVCLITLFLIKNGPFQESSLPSSQPESHSRQRSLQLSGKQLEQPPIPRSCV